MYVRAHCGKSKNDIYIRKKKREEKWKEGAIL